MYTWHNRRAHVHTRHSYSCVHHYRSGASREALMNIMNDSVPRARAFSFKFRVECCSRRFRFIAHLDSQCALRRLLRGRKTHEKEANSSRRSIVWRCAKRTRERVSKSSKRLDSVASKLTQWCRCKRTRWYTHREKISIFNRECRGFHS